MCINLVIFVFKINRYKLDINSSMKNLKELILLSSLVLFLGSCGKNSSVKNDPYMKAEQVMIPFSLSDVELTDSPFKNAMDLDEKWILGFEADRLLAGFLIEAGLEPKAPRYGGWEGGALSGQSFGHYLSACALMYAATGNPELLQRIEYSIAELDTCQQKIGTGQLSSYPNSIGLFQEIAKGDIKTKGFDVNGRAVPLYILHKLFAGLTDVYKYTGNQKSFDILVNLSDWFLSVFEPLSDEQIQTILVAEHGGINESLAEMYALTGNEKYLKMSERLNHQNILNPLSKQQDQLVGLHANTQIPKVVGVMREYELTGNEDYLKTAGYFWDRVVNHHSYVLGGNSEAEHFGMPDKTCDRLTDKTCETCNTYNMLKLTKHLYQLSGSLEKVEYYERALYNHILASQHPETGMICYMSPLNAGGQKGFSTPFDSFWCCVGTGIENHAKYGEFIYYTDKNENLYVNLFIPSVLNWKDREIKFTQTTGFPESDTVNFKLGMQRSQNFALNIRFPEWAKQGCSLWVNNEEIKTNTTPGNYISIQRKWSDGDQIKYVIPKSITTEAALGDSSIIAYLYGPLVLAALMPDDQQNAPLLVGNNKIVEEPSSDNELHFRTTTAYPENLEMIPYYQTTDKRTAVYFKHYTDEQWKNDKEEILLQQNKEQWLKTRTVSFFQPGEMQPERDHHFDGENIELGEIHERKFRKAIDGGWFSFTMKILPNEPVNMICTYWGDLGDIYKFNVFVDDQQVGSTEIIHWWGNKFVDKVYTLPAELTKGKDEIKVRFEALDKTSVAGPLFGCVIVKQK